MTHFESTAADYGCRRQSATCPRANLHGRRGHAIFVAYRPDKLRVNQRTVGDRRVAGLCFPSARQDDRWSGKACIAPLAKVAFRQFFASTCKDLEAQCP